MLGSIIGAGASLLGGVLGSNKAEKAQQREYAAQKEFAQSGIQWKVADAKAAGIHPLYALGANTVSYSPQSVGDGGLGSAISGAGQNIGRAIDATRSGSAKTEALASTLATVQIEGAALDNDIKRAQLNSALATNRPMQTPNMPGVDDRYMLPGQGNSPLATSGPKIEFEKKIAPADRSNPHMEAGQVPEVQYARTPTGWAPTMPQSISESYENDWIGGWQWQARNKYAPGLGASNFTDNPYWRPPPIPLKHGEKWHYNLGVGEWQIRQGFRSHFTK